MKKKIGYNMKVWQHHLDFLVWQMMEGPQQDISNILLEYISRDIRGERSRQKTLTILLKIWVNVPDSRRRMRDDAFTLYADATQGERAALHWSMIVLAYPFFRDVVYELGRLFRLQEVVASPQISRKMNRLYGERHSVSVSTTAVLSTLREWEIIQTKRRYENVATEPMVIHSPRVKNWLVSAIVRASDQDHLNIDLLNRHPVFFPFDMSIGLHQLDQDAFIITRQGLDQTMVGVK